MTISHLIYASRPFGFDDAMLNGILTDARRCNPRDDITGALICRADLYLQLLEGPRAALDATYERILRDDRHLEVSRLVYGTSSTRLFPDWSMRSDPARSWMWSMKDVAAGALARTSSDELLGVFGRLAVEPEPEAA